jgi:hypothetical protein
VHFQLNENLTPKNLIAEFYKNKNAQQAGVFDLMLTPKKLELYLQDFNEKEISGTLLGQMQSKVNADDIRDVLFVFKNIPIKTTAELKKCR